MSAVNTRVAALTVFLSCTTCVTSVPVVAPTTLEGAASETTPAPPPNDLSDILPTFKPPADPLLTTRVPASVPAVHLPPQKDPYAPDVEPDYNLTCQEFNDLLKTAQPTTVEEMLGAIQKQRPKFLRRAVFAYETKMAYDGASLMYPRLIVYGGDAKTILNFGGHAKQKFYDRVETVCFDEKEARFDFYDLAFPKEENTGIQKPVPAVPQAPAGPSPASIPSLPAQVSPVVMPEATAALTEEERKQKYVLLPGGRGVRTCANCHQLPSRPNWDTFDLWPGFYGAADDTLKDRERPDRRNVYNSFESSMWARFQSVPAKGGRYRFITQELARPNSDFTLKLSFLNGRRIVGDLKRMGAVFEPRKYEFAKALFCAPKAERRYFRQLSGDTSVGATYGVLPTNSDVVTREIFLSSYYDEMQKERRLGAVLSEFSIPSPLPKERFEELRKYYRALLDPNNELNLDMRLTMVDADEVLLIRELKRVTDKLDIDIENWSMVRDGGFVHENGLGGDGRVALRLILERPFIENFLGDDKDLSEALIARQEKESAHHSNKSGADGGKLGEEVIDHNKKVCALIDNRLKRDASEKRSAASVAD